MRVSIRDLFVTATLLTAAAFLFSFTILLEWRLALRLPVYFLSVMTAGAGVGTLFHQKLPGMGLGVVCGLAYFCYWLSRVGVRQFLGQF